VNLQHFLYLYFWIAPHLLLPFVALAMFRRNLHREFPVFFSYLIFEFVQFCVLFVSYYSSWISIATYQNIDMFGRVGSIALRFGIIREMFEAPLNRSAPLRRAMARTLNIVSAVLVVLAIGFIGALYYGQSDNQFFPPYLISQALNIAQCGLLGMVFLWHRFLALRMSPMTFGIAAGMGLVAGFEPLAHALKNALPAQSALVPDWLQMAIYHCAALFWLYCAMSREPITASTRSDLPQLRGAADDMGRFIRL
jgi:hypothetical protein